MNERIYRTPRTYGSPTGYDIELSHLQNQKGRLAEALLRDMLVSGAHSTIPVTALTERACRIADCFYADLERRNWMIEIADAPDMEKDYGTKRGEV